MPPSPAYRPQTAILELGADSTTRLKPPTSQAVVRLSKDRGRGGRLGARDKNGGATSAVRGAGGNISSSWRSLSWAPFRPTIRTLATGRGFLFAQLRDAQALMDRALGSGQTPWSRFGDGRCSEGRMREIIATERLEAMGVETAAHSRDETGRRLTGRRALPQPVGGMGRLSTPYPIGTFSGSRPGAGRGFEEAHEYCLSHYFGEQGGETAGRLRPMWGGTARLALPTRCRVRPRRAQQRISSHGESFD